MTVNRIAAGAAVCCAVLFVSACGGSTPATVGASGTSTTAARGGAGGDAAGGARGFPGATGLLAQIDGKTLQVQGTDTQTAVTYSAKTTFTNTVAAKLSDVVVGVCVQARSAQPASGAGGAAPTAAAGPVAAASVEISPAVNGRCTVGGSQMPGAGAPGGGDPTRPTGMPTSGRTRGSGAGGGFFGLGAFGKVTAVNGAGFTVESMRPQEGSTTPVVPTAQIVKPSAATTYTRTEAANANALVVGLCVTALGKADNTGSIAATSITLRPAQNGSCSTGFGGPPPGGMPTPAGGGSGA
ncbi:MAG TPA: hypothetical protein VIJ07_12355 [Dermatophilaceae bacterium]